MVEHVLSVVAFSEMQERGVASFMTEHVLSVTAFSEPQETGVASRLNTY